MPVMSNEANERLKYTLSMCRLGRTLSWKSFFVLIGRISRLLSLTRLSFLGRWEMLRWDSPKACHSGSSCVKGAAAIKVSYKLPQPPMPLSCPAREQHERGEASADLRHTPDPEAPPWPPVIILPLGGGKKNVFGLGQTPASLYICWRRVIEPW